jgi:hypothetical protein
MVNERSNGYKYKSNSILKITTRSLVMVVVMIMMMKIDFLASNDPSNSDDGSLLASSPYGSLPVVRFRGFLVALGLASQIVLHRVIIFDKAVLIMGGTCIKHLETSLCEFLEWLDLVRCWKVFIS